MPRWTQQSRQQQRERIFQQRPWLQATGPVTSYGKQVASRNAVKKKRSFLPDVAFVSHPYQEGETDRPLQVGDRVTYTGGFAPTMLACGDSPLEVVGFCSLGTGAIACQTAAGKIIWIYGKDLRPCPGGHQRAD